MPTFERFDVRQLVGTKQGGFQVIECREAVCEFGRRVLRECDIAGEQLETLMTVAFEDNLSPVSEAMDACNAVTGYGRLVHGGQESALYLAAP